MLFGTFTSPHKPFMQGRGIDEAVKIGDFIIGLI
jgi:hypothetical protein